MKFLLPDQDHAIEPAVVLFETQLLVVGSLEVQVDLLLDVFLGLPGIPLDDFVDVEASGNVREIAGHPIAEHPHHQEVLLSLLLELVLETVEENLEEESLDQDEGLPDGELDELLVVAEEREKKREVNSLRELNN